MDGRPGSGGDTSRLERWQEERRGKRKAGRMGRWGMGRGDGEVGDGQSGMGGMGGVGWRGRQRGSLQLDSGFEESVLKMISKDRSGFTPSSLHVEPRCRGDQPLLPSLC